jgi:ATP-binding cassette subfamily B protein
MLEQPLVMMYAMGHMDELMGDSGMGIDSAKLAAMQNDPAAMEQMLEQYGEISDSILSQIAVQSVTEEYEACGVNLDDMQKNYLLNTGAKMMGLSFLMLAAAILCGFLSARTGAKIGMELRGGVFKNVLGFSNVEMNQFSTASLITRSTNDIQQIQMVSTMLLRMVFYAPILGIGGILKVVSTKTGMGWIIAVAVVVISGLVLTLMGITLPKFKMMQKLVDRLNLVSREILTGLPVIRAFSREKFEEERFDVANKDLMGTQLFTNRVMTMMMPAMMLIMNGVTVMIVWFGGKGIDVGNLQVGDMIAFITYTMQIIMSFLMLTMISVMLPRAGVAADRIDEVIRTTSSISDGEQVRDDERADWKGEVTFSDVSFRYEGADEDALSHISFTAKPGETTAIIGSTGCGKSTLVNLIPRFYDVSEGSVAIDGIDIRELSQKKLRSLLGVVPQKGVLFSGDITSNLKFGGDYITDEQMREAAEIAQATEFIEEKPKKYKSEISQGGTNVSGGQKQRLSIARAIAKQPKVLIFDDSFSALDYKTDAKLRHALAEKTGDATVIIVAQRINTILHADQILVLEDGKLVGQGTHEQLLASCEAYQEIASSQLSEEELKAAGKGGVH